MNLERLLEDGVIVAADDWLNMIVIWNGSATFNVWSHVEGDAYRNVDSFTRYNIQNVAMAKLSGRKYLANVYDQMEAA